MKYFLVGARCSETSQNTTPLGNGQREFFLDFVVVVVVVSNFVFFSVLVIARPHCTLHRWATDGRREGQCSLLLLLFLFFCFCVCSRGNKTLLYITPVGKGRREGGPRQFDRGCRRSSITFDKDIQNTLRASDCLFLLESDGIGVLEFVRCSPDDLWKTPLFMDRLVFNLYISLILPVEIG